MPGNWYVMQIHADVFRTQGSKHLCSAHSQMLQLKPDHIQMPGMLPLRRQSWQFYFLKRRESDRIHFRNLTAPSDPMRQFFQLTKSERALNVGKAIVIPELFHFVVPRPGKLPLPVIAGDSVIAKHSEALRKRGIVGRDHSSFASRDVLHRMHAEDV